MGIVNRRNAVLGWVTWLTAKRVLKKKAKEAVPGTIEGTKRPNKGAIVSLLAVVGGALYFWRRDSGDSGEGGESGDRAAADDA
jgi:hypothetical protein